MNNSESSLLSGTYHLVENDVWVHTHLNMRMRTVHVCINIHTTRKTVRSTTMKTTKGFDWGWLGLLFLEGFSDKTDTENEAWMSWSQSSENQWGRNSPDRRNELESYTGEGSNLLLGFWRSLWLLCKVWIVEGQRWVPEWSFCSVPRESPLWSGLSWKKETKADCFRGRANRTCW